MYNRSSVIFFLLKPCPVRPRHHSVSMTQGCLMSLFPVWINKSQLKCQEQLNHNNRPAPTCTKRMWANRGPHVRIFAPEWRTVVGPKNLKAWSWTLLSIPSDYIDLIINIQYISDRCSLLFTCHKYCNTNNTFKMIFRVNLLENPLRKLNIEMLAFSIAFNPISYIYII